MARVLLDEGDIGPRRGRKGGGGGGSGEGVERRKGT